MRLAVRIENHPESGEPFACELDIVTGKYTRVNGPLLQSEVEEMNKNPSLIRDYFDNRNARDNFQLAKWWAEQLTT